MCLSASAECVNFGRFMKQERRQNDFNPQVLTPRDIDMINVTRVNQIAMAHFTPSEKTERQSP